MLLESLFERGSISVMQRMMAFTEERHRVLANNISNFDTVGYQMRDLPVQEFNDALNAAVKRRNHRGVGARLDIRSTRHVRWDQNGHIQVSSTEIKNNNILFHDKNNRFVEKQMSEMSKNTAKHTLVSNILRQQYDLLRTAIRGRL